MELGDTSQFGAKPMGDFHLVGIVVFVGIGHWWGTRGGRDTVIDRVCLDQLNWVITCICVIIRSVMQNFLPAILRPASYAPS
jgi:hypothetical protein